MKGNVMGWPWVMLLLKMAPFFVTSASFISGHYWFFDERLAAMFIILQ